MTPEYEFARFRMRSHSIPNIPGFFALIDAFGEAHKALTVLERALYTVGDPFVSQKAVQSASLRDAYGYFEYQFKTNRLQRSRFLGTEEGLTTKMLETPAVHRGALMLGAIHMNSPLDLSFIGNLNPLEAIRQFLKDHHERKLDHQYRSRADQEHRNLQNILLRAQIDSQQISNWERVLEIARKNGATEAQVQRLLEQRVAPSLERLSAFTDAVRLEPYLEVEPLKHINQNMAEELRHHAYTDRDDA